MRFDLDLKALTGEAKAALEWVKLGRPVVIVEGSYPVAVILPYPVQALAETAEPPPLPSWVALASARHEGAPAPAGEPSM